VISTAISGPLLKMLILPFCGVSLARGVNTWLIESACLFLHLLCACVLGRDFFFIFWSEFIIVSLLILPSPEGLLWVSLLFCHDYLNAFLTFSSQNTHCSVPFPISAIFKGCLRVCPWRKSYLCSPSPLHTSIGRGLRAGRLPSPTAQTRLSLAFHKPPVNLQILSAFGW